MSQNRTVFVPCVFRRSAFSGERVFVIRYGDGWEHCGVASVAYCLSPDRSPLGDGPPAGSEAGGVVMGLQIAPSEGGVARVQLPDGEVYDLPESRIEVKEPCRCCGCR